MSLQSWYHDGHPPACTCVRCEEQRSGRPPLRDPPRRDHVRIFRSKGRNPNAAFRVVRVKDATTPFRMIGEDIRVAYRCPTKAVSVLTFANRGATKQAAIEVGESLNVDWVESLCDGLFVP